MIDRSSATDYSGKSWWIMDADTCHNTDVTKSVHNQDLIKNSLNRLKSYNFNTNPINYDPNCDFILDNSIGSNEPVMGYTSCGRHSWMLQCGDTAYIQLCLDFDYANGALFNTFDSYNGFSMTIDNRYEDHGMVSEFIKMGGTCGLGHTWEPLLGGIAKNDNLFNLYQMGYSFADAAYQSIPILAWNNVVIGDPLTTIAWGKQSLISNLSWSGTNIVTGEVTIPAGKTLTSANNSIINLRHQGFITGEGELVVGQNVTFNIYSWQKGLFLSYDSDHPRLVWGMHPTLGTGANYRVYRKFGVNGSWVLIATTSAKEYKDLQMQFSVIGDEADNLFYKVIAFSELPGTYESNIVACTGNKAPKKIIANQNLNSPVEYSLEQNYPNPFNPTTQINYSIRETGLVQLKIYDILGKEVATLVNENKEAGNYSIDFNASELPSGVYIYQLTTPGFTQARKMILAK